MPPQPYVLRSWEEAPLISVRCIPQTLYITIEIFSLSLWLHLFGTFLIMSSCCTFQNTAIILKYEKKCILGRNTPVNWEDVGDEMFVQRMKLYSHCWKVDCVFSSELFLSSFSSSSSQIEDGEIYASINQKDGMVCFHDNPEKYNNPAMLHKIDQEVCNNIAKLLNSLLSGWRGNRAVVHTWRLICVRNYGLKWAQGCINCTRAKLLRHFSCFIIIIF